MQCDKQGAKVEKLSTECQLTHRKGCLISERSKIHEVGLPVLYVLDCKVVEMDDGLGSWLVSGNSSSKSDCYATDRQGVVVEVSLCTALRTYEVGVRSRRSVIEMVQIQGDKNRFGDIWLM